MSRSRSDPRVFIDTSIYCGATDRRDAGHLVASATLRTLVAARRPQLTTNFIVAEVHAPVLARINRQVAAGVLAWLRAGQVIVRVRSADEVRAEAIIAQYAGKDFTFTDATSFVVMERLGITVAYSLDSDFAQFGWQVLRVEPEDA